MGIIYVTPKDSLSIRAGEAVYLKDAAEYSGEEEHLVSLDGVLLTEDTKSEGLFTITRLALVDKIREVLPGITVTLVGGGDVLVTVNSAVPKENRLRQKLGDYLIYLFVFLGSAFSVMYFHIDVDMLGAQRELTRILTGVYTENILWLAIPYCLGIGGGMYLFFRNKRVAGVKIPSPIDLKMNNYESGISSFLKGKLKGKGKDGN